MEGWNLDRCQSSNDLRANGGKSYWIGQRSAIPNRRLFRRGTEHVYLMHRNSDLWTSVKQCHMLPVDVINARHIVVAGCVSCFPSASHWHTAIPTIDCAKYREKLRNLMRSR